MISVPDVAGVLSISGRNASRALARWNTQGWVKRLRRGVYVPVPLASLGEAQVLDDPWVVVPSLFGPAYIGGWSAAEHWGLTEQVFRGVCVLTSRAVRGKRKIIQGVEFSLKQVQPRAFFATRVLWRGAVKIELSDPAKTIIDMLDDPSIGGGIRHVGECLNNFFNQAKGTAQDLLDVGERLGNGAVFKRLGFLAEQRGGPEALITGCRALLTSGNARLEPGLSTPRLVRRWRIWVPRSWPETPSS